MGHVTKALWWICTPIWDVCNTVLKYVATLTRNFKPRCTATCVAMASSFYPSSCVWAQMLPPKYEVDTIVHYHVNAHFICITCSCFLDLRSICIQIKSRDREFVLNVCANFEVYTPFRFWNRQPYFAAVCLESGPRILHFMKAYCRETVGLEAAPRIIASIVVAKI